MATLKVLPESHPPLPKEYVLTLSEAEARAVRTLCGNVSGRGAFRDASGAVWQVLDEEIHGEEECANVECDEVIHVNESMNRYVEGKEDDDE